MKEKIKLLAEKVMGFIELDDGRYYEKDSLA